MGKAELGSDVVVRCPPGACDDGFMINYALDLEAQSGDSFGRSGDSQTLMAGGSARAGSGASAAKLTKVRIVTNDLFRDHRALVNKAWIQEHTVKYTFVSGIFVPQAEGK